MVALVKISLYTDDLRSAPVDVVAVGVFSDEPDRGLSFSDLNRALDGALEQACRDENFKGKRGQTLVFNVHKGLEARRVALFGYGEKAAYRPETARHFAGAMTRLADGAGAKSVALQLTILDSAEEPAGAGGVLALVQALTEGAELGVYRYDEYRTTEDKPRALSAVRIAFVAEDVQGVKGTALREAVRRGEAVAEAVAVARDLVNCPPNVLTPAQLAERAKKVAKIDGLSCKVLDPRDLARQNMHLHLGVGRGSENEPRLIHMSYSPEEPSSKRVVALVGKGLTFDAGGLSLKTSEGMVDMKIDMGGGAAVIGAMQAVARLAPSIEVHGIIGAAENMPDGRAIRPGDVFPSKKGLTVEIINTDAEGRLVLADALAYAQAHKPTHMVNLATLTGACMVALGRVHAGAFLRDAEMEALLKSAWNRSGELFWPLPLAAELRDQLDSEVADIKNIGERWGGAITAALFLGAFVDQDVQWAHLDIAGPVFSTKERGYISKGGTGFAVRTLVDLVELIAKTDT